MAEIVGADPAGTVPAVTAPSIDERLRLEALHGLELLDTEPEERFDRITRIAAALFEVPVAVVNLVDADRQWAKACIGLDNRESPLAVSFCARAIVSDEPLVVPDTHEDPRFAEMAVVTGPPHLRFYAGQPIAAAGGFRVGTLCIAGPEPRGMTPDQLGLLRDLARIAENELNREELSTALAARRESEARMAAVMDAVAEGIVTFDSAGRVLSANPAAERAFGIGPRQLSGTRVEERLTAAGWEEIAPLLGLAGGSPSLLGRRRIVEGRRADGSVFPLELVITGTVVDGEPLFIAIGQDVTERMEVERLKDEFVSVVGHELRTPLTSIRGSLGLLEGGLAGELPGEAAEMVAIARTNTDRLVRLVTDILDIERIEAGRADLEPVPVAVAELLEAARGVVQIVADGAGVTLDCGDAEGVVLADADRIVQALTNLIGNAVKFSPAGSAVRASAGIEGDVVRFTVADEGRGIPPEQLEAIFERFRQVDASDRREKGGTGLGLAIARAIVDEHGGRIWAESAPGRGTRFHFTLPAAEGPA
jgi:PAS domain S-box-containing protein